MKSKTQTKNAEIISISEAERETNMNRREFVKRAFAVAGAVTMSHFTFANEGEKKMKVEYRGDRSVRDGAYYDKVKAFPSVFTQRCREAEFAEAFRR